MALNPVIMTAVILFSVSSRRDVSALAETARRSGIERSGSPSAEQCRNLAAWQRRSGMQLTALRKSWTRLAAILEQGRSAEVDAACRGFRSELDRLERDFLLQVPDSAVRIHLARGLGELDAARRRCSAVRRFDLGYRLGRARRSMIQVHHLLRRYRESCVAGRSE